MQVNIDQNAEAIVKKLMADGRFPSVDSVVNSIITQATVSTSADESQRLRLPEPVLATDEGLVPAELTRNNSVPVEATICQGRLPDFLGVE